MSPFIMEQKASIEKKDGEKVDAFVKKRKRQKRGRTSMQLYFVGNGVGMFSLKKCVEMASSGDVIEFTQRDYTEDIGALYLEKNLTIKGYILKEPNGSTHYASNLKGMIFVKNQAKVVLENLWIYNDCEKSNLLNCKGQSTLEIHSVVLENCQTSGDVYPIVYGENSNLTLSGLIVRASEYRYNSLYFKNSTVVINNNSSLRECRVELDERSRGTIKDVSISDNFSTSTLVINNGSHCEIDNLNLTAKYLEYSAVFVTNHSYLSMKNSTVQQKDGYFAVLIKAYSDLEIAHCDVAGIDAVLSKVKISDCTVRETLSVENDSCVQIADSVNLLGENPTKVDIYVDNHSVLYGGKVFFNREINPNLKVINQSVCNIQQLEYIGGDIKDLIFEKDEDNAFVCQSMHDVVEKGAAQKVATADGAGPRMDSQQTRQALDNLIGLSAVKKEIDRMISMVNLNKKRMEMGLEPEPVSLHSVFMGNPGTGKTTVARMIGEILWEAGAFKGDEFKFIEATEPDMVSSNVGETAERTFALLEKAKGGVLFIDEAYVLNKKDSSVNHGQEAINSILKYMEDHRDEIMIIFAGYTKEMEQFLQTNPGLQSRVPNTFVFDDYTPDEIVAMGTKMLLDKKYVFENQDYYKQLVAQAYKNSLDHSNARWIRNTNERLIKVMAERLVETGDEDILTIRNADIKAVFDTGRPDDDKEDAMESLDKLIGIANVKQQVKDFIAMVELNQKREDQGLESSGYTLHSLFLGNPGTGKTTVARIIGKILYQKKIIPSKKFIEVSRTDLVAGYIGQTGQKTREVLESALGGVLFIDEAYSLNSGYSNDFGSEAVDEILKYMEDHRKDMVIIFAGYTKEMSEFLQMNSGLESRVPNVFDFEDYSLDELVQIGLLQLSGMQYRVDETSYRDTLQKCLATSNDHSNGRWVRNYNEKIVRFLSRRLTSNPSADITLITEADLQETLASYQ